jgi:hypothetical protein
MSDIFRVFGTQLDPAVVQALQRHEKRRRTRERERQRELERAARKRRSSTVRSRRPNAAADKD